MDSATRLAVSKRYSSYNDVTFYTIRRGIVTLHGSAEGHGAPDSWRVEVGSRTYRHQDLSDLKAVTLRYREILRVVKAIKAGRI